MAKNVFWITDRRGNKLSNFHARMLQERVGDFVVYCTPDNKVLLNQAPLARLQALLFSGLSM